MFSSNRSEKATLLPTIEEDKILEIEQQTPATNYHIIEFTLLFLTFVLAGFHTFILNFDFTSPSSGASSYSTLRCSLGPLLLPIAQALPYALYIGFPTAAAFFIATPIYAKEEAVGIVRCLTAFCYLLGATWGAAMAGRGMDAQGVLDAIRVSCLA